MEKKNSLETAIKIAKQYIALNPRTLSYRIDLKSTEDDSEGSYYYQLSEDEKRVMQEWCDLKEDDDMYGVYLAEYLEAKGYGELVKRLIVVNSFDHLDIVDSCDLTDTQKKFRFRFYFFDADKEIVRPIRTASYPLTDDEYALLLAYHLMDEYQTVNKLMMLCPEIMNRINKEFAEDFPLPFLIYFDELVDVARRIMDPFTDALGIYESDEQEIREFAKEFIFRPECITIYKKYEGRAYLHCEELIEGKKLVITRYKGTYDEDDEEVITVSLDAVGLCKHLNLTGFKELVYYFAAHYNVEDTLERIKSDFGGFFEK